MVFVTIFILLLLALVVLTTKPRARSEFMGLMPWCAGVASGLRATRP